MNDSMEEDHSSDDSDREIQAAFQAGLLKKGLHALVPVTREKVNNVKELKERLLDFTKKLPWIESVDVTSPSGVTQEIAEDDFQREIAFYKQAEHAAKAAIKQLQSAGVSVFRPKDYYAEMVKTDSHMQKIRKRMVDVQDQKEKSDTLKRIKMEKMFASKVQRESLQQKSTEQKKLLEAVKKHKKGMKGQLEQMLSNARKMQLDDDGDDGKSNDFDGGRKFSRQARDKKYGLGGRKKGRKINDARSHEEVFAKPLRGHVSKRGRGGARGGRGGGGRGKGRR